MSGEHAYRLASSVEDRLHQRKLEAVMSTSCLACGVTFNGTAADCFDWATTHRETEHPALVDRGQKARRDAARSAPTSYWSSRTTQGEM